MLILGKATATVDPECENLFKKKKTARNLANVGNKFEVIDEARKRNVIVHCSQLMDQCHLKNAVWEKKHQNRKGRIEKWYCESRCRLFGSVHRIRIISVPSEGRLKNGDNFKITRMRKTSSRRSIGVCTWQHTTIDATSLGVGKSCGKVLENFFSWYWTETRYQGWRQWKPHEKE